MRIRPEPGRWATLGHLDPGVCFVGDFEPIKSIPEGSLGGYIRPCGEKLDRFGGAVIGALHGMVYLVNVCGPF
jgi:hypothetical protein